MAGKEYPCPYEKNVMCVMLEPCAECAWFPFNTKEKKFTSANTAGFQLPLTMESCVEHLRAMWGDIYITAEVRCAVEETHDYIERKLQTLL